MQYSDIVETAINSNFICLECNHTLSEFHPNSPTLNVMDSWPIFLLQGTTFTAVEPEHGINNLCHFGDSGLLFMASEDSKMLTYYIPVSLSIHKLVLIKWHHHTYHQSPHFQSLGPAPRWCSFLDNLTEELEEDPEPTIYDDYKFVTTKDLDNLGVWLIMWCTPARHVTCATFRTVASHWD